MDLIAVAILAAAYLTMFAVATLGMLRIEAKYRKAKQANDDKYELAMKRLNEEYQAHGGNG